MRPPFSPPNRRVLRACFFVFFAEFFQTAPPFSAKMPCWTAKTIAKPAQKESILL